MPAPAPPPLENEAAGPEIGVFYPSRVYCKLRDEQKAHATSERVAAPVRKSFDPVGLIQSPVHHTTSAAHAFGGRPACSKPNLASPASASAKALPPTSMAANTATTGELPPGWKSSLDAHGVSYFYNKNINISQYEKPDLDSPPLPPPPPAPRQHHRDAGSSVQHQYMRSALQQDSTTTSTRHAMLSWQRGRDLARLRGMLLYSSGKEKAEIAGDLAALESEIYRHV